MHLLAWVASAEKLLGVTLKVGTMIVFFINKEHTGPYLMSWPWREYCYLSSHMKV